MTEPFAIPTLAGLRTSDVLSPIGAATAENVEFSANGVLRNRPGRSYYSTGDSGATYNNSAYRMVDGRANGNDPGIYVVDGGKFYSVTSSTVTSVAITPNTGLGVDICLFGNKVYVSDNNGLRSYTAGAFTNIGTTTTPRGGFLAVQPLDARLVCAYAAINGTPVPSRVHFSNPGTVAAPTGYETWTSTDYVDLEPGNGEVITGICTLADSVVVFKQTRAYVFYGNSTNADGSTKFNFRTVNLGDTIAPGSLHPGRFSSDGEAIYYVASRGVYLMAGATPQLISDKITIGVFDGGSLDQNSTWVTATADKLYCGDDGVTGQHILVLDKTTGEWSTFSFRAPAMCPAGTARSAFAFDSSKRITLLDPTLTTELGGTLTATYVSNLQDCGSPKQKRLRQSWIQGQWDSPSTMAFGVNTITTANTASVAQTTGASYAPAFNRVASQGYSFSFAFTATGAFTVSRIGADLADQRHR